MPKQSVMPPSVTAMFSGRGFRARAPLALPFLTVDPGGYPRAALLTFGEIRATSPRMLNVAVRRESRSAQNLDRRHGATIGWIGPGRAVWIQTRAGRGRPCQADARRRIFSLAVVGVKLDRPPAREGAFLRSGPAFVAKDPRRLFSAPLFDELGGRTRSR